MSEISEPRSSTTASPPRMPTQPPAERRARCTNCGLIQPVRAEGACRECGHTRFASA